MRCATTSRISQRAQALGLVHASAGKAARYCFSRSNSVWRTLTHSACVDIVFPSLRLPVVPTGDIALSGPCFALWPITNKAVSVRHFNLRERFCVHPRLWVDDAVEEKEVSAHRVHFVVREGLRSIERHGPTNIVEQRGRVGPIAPDGFYGFLRGQRAYPSHEGIGGSFYTLHPMTTSALRVINGTSCGSRTATGRKSATIGWNADIPSGDFFGLDFTTEIGTGEGGSDNEHDGSHQN